MTTYISRRVLQSIPLLLIINIRNRWSCIRTGSLLKAPLEVGLT